LVSNSSAICVLKFSELA